MQVKIDHAPREHADLVEIKSGGAERPCLYIQHIDEGRAAGGFMLIAHGAKFVIEPRAENSFLLRLVK